MTYHVVNPAAGQGKADKVCEKYRKEDDVVYLTTGIGDAARYTEEICRTAPRDDPPHFLVYGGDGTVCEAACGIMAADAGQFAFLTPVPAGTGNDFVRSFENEPSGAEHLIDVLHVNDTYGINILNIGFDCSVVLSTAEWKKKPLISGSFAYILGVADTLFHKLGRVMEITWTDAGGNEHTVKDNFLLCLAANESFYGGGFKAAPIASAEDGLIDLMLVKTVSRLKFIKLVSSYRKGTHITPDGKPAKGFEEFIRYEKCTSVRITGIAEYCRDGEIAKADALDISIVPRALQCRVL